MLHARLVCSDGGCAVLYEAYGPGAEIDALTCDCGCGLQALGWPAPVEERVAVGLALMPLDR